MRQSQRGAPGSAADLPAFIEAALMERGLLELFFARPAAHQGHYVRRVLRAARAQTVRKRLDQLLDELEGGLYMQKPWLPRRR